MELIRFEISIKVRLFIAYIGFLWFCETTKTISYLILYLDYFVLIQSRVVLKTLISVVTKTTSPDHLFARSLVPLTQDNLVNQLFRTAPIIGGFGGETSGPP